MVATGERTADITREIITGRLLAIVDEMGIVLARASMSPVVYEVLDFACGICDRDGNLVAQNNGITLFTGTFSGQVRFIRDRFAADLQPGDTFLTNDPFEGGTHACDFALIRPVFVDGVRFAWAIAVAHLLDVGGAVPGSLPPDATSVFQEGLRLSGVRVTRDDRLVEDVVRIITENVRLPTLAMGDINAEIAAVRIAERRLVETANKYGCDVLTRVFSDILHASEAEARKALAALPDGEYVAQDAFDGDGATDEPVPVRAVVRVIGDRMEVDFTGSSAARDAPINCSVGALQSAVKTVFKALVAPHEPSNEGWFRPLTVVVPPGTVFSAAKPKPTGWYYEASAQASELVWRALAPLAPGRLSAGSYMSLCATYITGCTEDGEFVHIEPQHGGWGATAGNDGASGLIAVTDGDTYNYSIELLEAKFPLLVRRYGYDVEGGAGAGRRRGGFGLLREYEIEADGARLHASFGRTRTPAWGTDGGGPGGVNGIEVFRADAVHRLARPSGFRLERGDRVRIITAGGGGWGAALERPVEMVAADVRAGLITLEAARKDYGVVVDPVSCEADRNATARLRASR
jgi:N-methylhydantoinase B